jgi:hypothetical protein
MQWLYAAAAVLGTALPLALVITVAFFYKLSR